MSRLLQMLGASVAGMLLLATSALADDWTAVQLRGQVLQLIDNQWQPLQRGMVVPDSRLIRTLVFGHVTFTRGQETVDLGPNTQIQIHDRGSAARPNTTVTQYFGSVSVEAQVENVRHFAVQTPYLAAVVKGTRFTVVSGQTGASVSVQRGHVEVDDHRNRSHTLITVGQSATVDAIKTGNDLAVSGSGTLPPVVAGDGKTMIGDSTGTGSTSSSGSSGKDSSGDDTSANTSNSSSGSSGGSGSSGDSNSGNGNSGSGNGSSGSGNGKGNSGNGNGNGGSNGKNSGKGKGGGDDS